MNHETVLQHFNSGQTNLLRVLWCDNANVIRAKSIFLPPWIAETGADATAHAFLQKFDMTVTAVADLQALPATQDAPAKHAGLGPTRDIVLQPDWATFTHCLATPQVGMVISDMMDGAQHWAVCPREYLRRMLRQAADQGVVIEVGAELEFYLLHEPQDPDHFPAPVDQSLFASTVGANASAAVIDDMLQTLWSQGVPVEQYYPESGPGQQEITLAHCSPLELADRIVIARETIRAVASRHQRIASFMPLIFEDATGSGMHVHFSLWNEGKQKSLMADPNGKWGLSTLAESFMSGVLHHLPAVMATTVPSVNSYRRIRPHEWSGAYQAWGVANKEAALRLIDDPVTAEPRHVELKTVDGSANPYIALATIIAAGLDGVTGKRVLPEPINVDPGNLTEEARNAHSIAPLPTSLSQAIKQLSNSDALRKAMGDQLATAFLAVRQAELESMRGMTFGEERRLFLLRY